MKKAAVIMVVLILTGCAGADIQTQKYWPLSKRLLSDNNSIRMGAVVEFTDLDEKGQKKTVLDMINLFSGEEEGAKRQKILDTLIELKAGSYAVVPLIKAAGRNSKVRQVGTIISFIKEVKPSRKDKQEIMKLMSEESWAIRAICMEVIKLF